MTSRSFDVTSAECAYGVDVIGKIFIHYLRFESRLIFYNLIIELYGATHDLFVWTQKNCDETDCVKQK
jgi:hypothetical protein